MIDLDFLQTLIRAIDDSSLDSIEIERGGTRVRLSKTPSGTVVTGPGGQGGGAPVPAGGHAVPGHAAHAPEGGAQAPGPAEAAGATDAPGAEDETERTDLVDITSPMVGTFYRAPAPDAPPYVDKGDRIAKGDTLCIIEAMKLMNELEAEVVGTIEEILVDDAEPVEFGQVLFRVNPT